MSSFYYRCVCEQVLTSAVVISILYLLPLFDFMSASPLIYLLYTTQVRYLIVNRDSFLQDYIQSCVYLKLW